MVSDILTRFIYLSKIYTRHMMRAKISFEARHIMNKKEMMTKVIYRSWFGLSRKTHNYYTRGLPVPIPLLGLEGTYQILQSYLDALEIDINLGDTIETLACKYYRKHRKFNAAILRVRI